MAERNSNALNASPGECCLWLCQLPLQTTASSYAVFYTGGHGAITAGHECRANAPVVQNDVAILSHLQKLDTFPGTRPV
jgi:hypothetical protein